MTSHSLRNWTLTGCTTLALVAAFGVAACTDEAAKPGDDKTATADKPAGDQKALSPALPTTKPIGPALSFIPDGKKAEDKVAMINGTTITYGDFQEQMKPFLPRLASLRPEDGDKMAMMRDRMLDRLIERTLLFQESQKRKITVEQPEVDGEWQKFKTRFPSAAEYNQFMTQSGITEERVKADMRQEIAIDKLIKAQVVSKVKIDDAAIKTYYDGNLEKFKHPMQLKASHILVKVDESMDAAKKTERKKKIDDILASLKKGGDFAKLAKENSECPSAQQGGDLGLFSPGQMVKPFEDAAMALKIGQLSGVVQTQFGYHIIKLTERREAGQSTMEQAKAEIEQQLSRERIGTEMKTFIDALKKDGKVEKYL